MPNYINKFQIGFSKVDAYLSVGVGGGQENNGTHWRDHFVCAPGLLRQLAEAAAEAANGYEAQFGKEKPPASVIPRSHAKKLLKRSNNG